MTALAPSVSVSDRLRAGLSAVRDWTTAGTDRRRLIITGSTGLISAAAFAPLDIWPLMPLAFMILVWQLDRAPGIRRAAMIGWAFGLGQFLAGLYWIAISWQYQGDMPAVLGWLAVLLLSMLLALFCGAATAAARWRWRGHPSRVLVLAACWALGEALRGTVLTGFPWNCVGSAWLPVAPLAQTAALFGVYGLSILMVMAGGALALLADPPSPAQSRWGAGMATGLGLLFLGGVVYILLTPIAYVRGVKLHVVQADIGQELKGSSDETRFQLRAHLDLTRNAVAERGPGIVIWPETAVPNLIDEELSTRYLIARALGDGSKLITGADRLVRGVNGSPISAMNSMIVLNDDGTIAEIYDKVHLVPFGEYMPWRDTMGALGLNRLVAGRIDFAPGARLRTIDVSGVPAFSPLICFEAGFPGEVVGWGPRPTWLLNISNDAWFGKSSGPFQHLALARLRAIEEGLPMVRSTPTGVSAIIDPHGRVRARTPFGGTSVLTSQLPEALAATPFARAGRLAFLLFAAATLALGLGVRPRS